MTHVITQVKCDPRYMIYMSLKRMCVTNTTVCCLSPLCIL